MAMQMEEGSSAQPDYIPPMKLHCTFCNTDEIEIKQTRERHLRASGPDAASWSGMPVRTIYEFKVYCPHCKRTYHQTCPGNILPRELAPAA